MNMNTVRYVLRLHKMLPICKACAQAILYREGRCSVRYSSSFYQPHYNDEEQKQILQVINDSSAEELSRYSISKGRLINLQKFRKKQGQFCTLAEVLEVDGLGVKVLEKFCDSILQQTDQPSHKESDGKEQAKAASKSTRNQILTPPMPSNQRMDLQTAVGIHICVSAVSWAHIDRQGNLLSWDIHRLNFDSKKLHLMTMFPVVQAIHAKIPKGDVYVLEDKQMSVIMSPQKPSSVSVNLQNCQLTAMFLALFNGSLKMSSQQYECVFFLRSRLPARLFGTLIGSERVSAQSVVLDILSGSKDTSGDNICDYTPVVAGDELKELYLNKSSMEKENLCWALLLIMTFMDLVVHQNSQCLNRIR